MEKVEKSTNNAWTPSLKLALWTAILSSSVLVAIAGGLKDVVLNLIGKQKIETPRNLDKSVQSSEKRIFNEDANYIPVLTEKPAKGYLINQDINYWDMTNWKQMDSTNTYPEKFSSVKLINTLEFTKTAQIDSIYLYFGTSGTGIGNLRCSTHGDSLNFSVKKKGNQHSKTYELVIDVSQEKIGIPFTVMVEGEYWNSFQGDMWVENYTESGEVYKKNMLFIITPPKNMTILNPVTEITKDTTYKNFVLFRGNGLVWNDTKQNKLTWDINKPEQSKMYRLSWQMKSK